MPDIPILLILIVIIAVFFDYTNGVHDSSNAIATVISTRALSPATAVIMAAVLNLAGAFLGTEVAATIGTGILKPGIIAGSHSMILAALLGAVVWNLFTWYIGLPSSSSHALIGALVGAAIAHNGWNAPNYQTIAGKVLVPLVLSPVSGFIMGYLIMLLIAWLTYNRKPQKLNKLFKRLQLGSAAFMAMSHGSNDAQKTMGIITLTLVLFKVIPSFEVPYWVTITCAVAISVGTATGGWKIIKTMGNKIFKMEPVHGFATATSSTLVIATSSMLGAPISTTQVISSAIMGVGSSKRLSAVKWKVAGNMLIAWVLTMPASAIVGALIFWLVQMIPG